MTANDLTANHARTAAGPHAEIPLYRRTPGDGSLFGLGPDGNGGEAASIPRSLAGPRVIFQAVPAPREREGAQGEAVGVARTFAGPRVIFQAVPLRRGGGEENGETL